MGERLGRGFRRKVCNSPRCQSGRPRNVKSTANRCVVTWSGLCYQAIGKPQWKIPLARISFLSVMNYTSP